MTAIASALPILAERLHGVARYIGRLLLSHARNPVARERTLAAAVFALIFVGFVGGVDFVVTGGPSWNPGGEAEAAEWTPQAHVRTPAPTLVNYAPPPAPLFAPAIDLRDYEIATEDLLGGPGANFRSASLDQASFDRAVFDPYAAYGERAADQVTGKAIDSSAF
jgi:hypothetical protein